MTGFALATRDTAAGQVCVELRSVNSRFLDLALRIPDELRFAEPDLRELIASQAQRGKVECRVSLRTGGAGSADPTINPAALTRLAALDAAIRSALPAAVPITVGEALRWPGIVSEAASADSLLPAILDAARTALTDFAATREREGGRLAELIRERAQAIDAIATQITGRLPELLSLHEARLVERLRGALGAATGAEPGATPVVVPIEETMARIRQEVALHGMRIDVDEEIGRLRSHVSELMRILGGPGPAGKRLDFLMQEFNREANTIGSKAAALSMTQAALELKLLVEQIREQVQNIE
jgi:uncharacterized protein (TIGR00255 family)